MMRLGPLYEEMGDTAKAIDAYEGVVDQWAEGDPRAQEEVLRHSCERGSPLYVVEGPSARCLILRSAGPS